MLKIANHYISKVVFLLLLLEIAVLFCAGYLGINIRLHEGVAWPENDHLGSYLPSVLTFAMAIIMGMSALGMYQRNFNEDKRTTALLLIPSFLIGLLVLVLVFYIAPELYLGRGILLLALLLGAIGVFVTRTFFFRLVSTRAMGSQVLFLGTGDLVRDCIATARNNVRNHKYHIVGAIPVVGEDSTVLPGEIIESADTLLATAGHYKAREIVVAVQNRRGGNLRIDELLECKLKGVQVIDAATFFEREACQIRLDCLQPSWLVFGSGFDQSLLRIVMKRAFDLLISAVMLVLLAPLMLAAIALIWLQDRGPALYYQERVGKNSKTFKVMKFRSMRIDAEQAGAPQWASTNDPRVTRWGNIMRKYRIDELPQLFNVLKGDMSFVGPRPERPYWVEQFGREILFYNVRHSVKPGITGWAQVRYKYGAGKDDAMQKLQYDLYYVKNNSLFLDVLIMIDTLNVVLFGAGT